MIVVMTASSFAYRGSWHRSGRRRAPTPLQRAGQSGVQPLCACVCVGLPTSVQSVPTLPTWTFGVKAVPVDCQIVNVPVLVLRQRRSSWLLVCPVKLPTSASAQPAAMLPTKLFGVKPLPVDCQTENVPLLWLNQTRSSLPLPAKSPTPARLQPAATDPVKTFGVKPLPVDCHSVNVLPLWQSRSSLPAPVQAAMVAGVP